MLLPCDGCGLPATQEHIGARIRRLELATQYRPIHIGILFVALAPPPRPEDDFYAPAQSREFSDSFLEGLEIPAASGGSTTEIATQRLAEFQRRGYFLSCLSECPLRSESDVAETIHRQASDLVRRIRFNYKPKQVALLGTELAPLVEVLAKAGIGPSLILHNGLPLPLPGTGQRDWKSLFHSAVASVSTSDYPPSGYDRIHSNLEAGNPGVGGGT